MNRQHVIDMCVAGRIATSDAVELVGKGLAKEAADAWHRRLGVALRLLKREVPTSTHTISSSTGGRWSQAEMAELAAAHMRRANIPPTSANMHRTVGMLQRDLAQGGSRTYTTQGAPEYTLTRAGKILGGIGLGSAALAATSAVGSAVDRMQERRNAKKGFGALLQQHPEFKDPTKFDQDRLKQHYRVLAKFNPEYASSPTVASAFLKRSLRSGDLGIDPVAVDKLVDARKAYRDSQQSKGALGSAIRALSVASGV